MESKYHTFHSTNSQSSISPGTSADSADSDVGGLKTSSRSIKNVIEFFEDVKDKRSSIGSMSDLRRGNTMPPPVPKRDYDTSPLMTSVSNTSTPISTTPTSNPPMDPFAVIPTTSISTTTTSPTIVSNNIGGGVGNASLEALLREEKSSHLHTKYLLKTLQEERNMLQYDCGIWKAKYYKLYTKVQKLNVILSHFEGVMAESESVPGDQHLNFTSAPKTPSRNSVSFDMASTMSASSGLSTYSVPNAPRSPLTEQQTDRFRSKTLSSIEKKSRTPFSNSSFTPNSPSHSHNNSNNSNHNSNNNSNGSSQSSSSSQQFQSIRNSSSSTALILEHPEPQNLSEEQYISMLDKRREVVLQVLKTEKEYSSHLSIIVENFLVPIKVETHQSSNPFISARDIKQVFGDVEVILGSSGLLIEDLEKILDTTSKFTPGLGDVFLKISDYFKMYTSYVKNYYNSITILNKLKEESHKFQSFIQEREATILTTTNYNDLGSLLVLPVTRIGQFTTMLIDIYRLTPQAHPDFEPFKNAVVKMKSIVDYVKEKSREYDSQNKVRIIQNSLVGKFKNLNLPHRRYVREGILNDVTSKTPNQIYCFLFNDIMLLSSANIGKKSNQYQYKKEIKLATSEVSIISDNDNRPLFQIKFIPSASADDSTSPSIHSNNLTTTLNGIISVTSSSASESKEEEPEFYIFEAESIRDREDWISNIQINIASASKKGSSLRRVEEIEKGDIDFNTSDIQLCEELGSGGSGCFVHRCTIDGLTCAVKLLKLKNTSPYLVDQFVSEINIMVQLSHPNIAKYLGHRLTSNPDRLWLFMEYYPYSLKDILSKRTTPFPIFESIWLILEIAKGLDFLHTCKQPIIHRDLKPGNVMCTLDENNRLANVRVCDFDTSKVLGSGVTLKTCIGTPCYMAAEVLDVNSQDSVDSSGGYTLKADIWSFGMLSFEILTLLAPYSQLSHLQTIEMILKGTPPPLPSSIVTSQSQPLIDLLLTCIDISPSKRPSSSSLVSKLGKLLKNVGNTTS
ncbi:hypothetical protein CYY_004502 [Polysphondylium violaceum]|uniref:Pleckstrin domain-containing protein n=1 Tax=Polysphondylium violaceum TaxID=133409 RepID=A0A8J4PY31_9MYCE|nr:hypothetical protein CYY_004502 [Polysphondylium violaceum]